MSDELQLGLSIVLDDKYINEFNKLMNAVRQIQKQLESFGDPTKKAKQTVIDLNNEFNKLNLKTKEITKTVNNIGKGITQSFQQANGQIVQVTRNADGTIVKLKTINKSTDSIASSIGNAASKMFLWSSAGFLLFNTIRGIQDGFRTLVSVESEIVNIRKVLPDDADFAPFAKGAQIISQQFGVSITDTLKAMQSWSRQVKDTNSIMQLTNSSMLAAAVTDITLESSYKALSSIIKQFSMDVSESSHVIDTFNELSNNMRLTAEDLAQGLAKTGSAAKLMGVDFDRAAGLVGTLVEVTSMTGSQAGTVLSRMFSRIHTDDAVNELQKLNINAFQPMSKTLDELGLRWNSLTKAQQENVAKALGGTHHYQKLLALFSNYNRVIEATIMAYDSMGSAEKEMQLAMSTYQKKLEQLKAAFQSLAVNLGNNMLPAFKNIIDGFRILITYHDGIIPKLALVAAGIWGLVAAFKALAAVQTITMTGWLGIGAALITGAAYLVGMSNSSKQATDSLTQLNNSMNIVNTSMTNLSKASERVRQVEYLSEMHEKLNAKLKTLDKSSKDYIDTLNLYKKVQIQINNLGNQYGIKLDKGKSQYEAEREQVSQLINKLKELETQKQRMYEKDLDRQIKQKQQFIQTINQQTFGDSGPDFFDLKRYYYQAWQKMDKEQIQRGREMTERWIRFNPNFSYDQINQHISAFRKDPTGWFKSMTAAFNQAQKDLVDLELERTKNALKGVELKGWGDPGKELKDKVQPIFTELTAETLKSIEEIGREWQNQINKVLSPDEQLKDDVATYVLKGQKGLLSLETTINRQMRDDLMKPFENINKASEDFKKNIASIDIQRTKLKATGEYTPQEEVNLQKQLGKVYDDYQVKLQEHYNTLEKIKSQLPSTTNGYKTLTQEMDKIQKTINQTKVDSDKQNKVIKQYNTLINTVDSLCTVLDKFGDSAEQAIADFARALSKAISIQGGNLIFDWKNATKEQKSNILTSGVNLLGQMLGASTEEIDFTSTGVGIGFALGGPVGAAIGGVLGLLGGSNAKKARKKMEAAQARANKAIEEYNKRMIDVNYGDTLAELSNLEQRLTSTPAQISYRNWYGKKKYTTNPEYVAIQEMIENTKQAIQDMIADLSKNLRNAIADAFGSTNNFVEFGQSLYQSVYNSVKEALLNAFVSSETMKPLFNSLSQLILDATMDGALTAEEVLGIREISTRIGSQMQVLYQSLGILDQYLGNLNPEDSSGGGSYTAGTATPIVYNNYISIHTLAFAGNEDEAREFALLMRDYIVAEEQRS